MRKRRGRTSRAARPRRRWRPGNLREPV